MDVYLHGGRIALDPTNLLGKGGEAEVYPLGTDQALKVFKTPDHPDLHGQRLEQQAARARLDEHQRKLPAFPAGLPAEVVRPLELVTDRRGKHVLGYTMRRIDRAEPLLRLSEPAFRRAFDGNSVLEVFRSLRRTVEELHRLGVVLGDFNDLNVLLSGTTPSLIDADSFQFGPFLTRVFTERFLDPLLMAKDQPLLARPYLPGADWFAFSALLFQSLLLVGPWGGIHRPNTAVAKVPAPQRPLQRISILRPDVQPPKPARPLSTLSDDWLQTFERIFHQDARAPFPEALLRSTTFARCPGCGLEHARASCPSCRPHATAKTQNVVTVRGALTARRLFTTDGVIVHAAVHRHQLRCVAHEGGAYRDTTGAILETGPLTPHLRFVSADKWWRLRGGAATDGATVLGTDSLVANDDHLYWSTGGSLYRDGQLGPERIGAVIDRFTRFSVGPRFGAGFYRAGNCTVLFTFDAHRGGVREDPKALSLRGELISARFAISDALAWLLLTTRDRGQLVHSATAVTPTGEVVASSAPDWLASLQADPVAVGPLLFVPTDAGVIRVEARAGAAVVTREFPDTEPFVDSATALLFDRGGLIAVREREIVQLSL